MPIKISQLPNLIINQINSSDLIPIVNSNVTKKVTLTDLSKKILGGLQFTSSLSGNTNINIGSENAMSINTSGSIGIGTSDPQAKLEVQGNILIGRTDNNYEGGQLSLARSYDNKPGWHIDVFGNTDSPNLRILTKGSELVTILPSGSVGIGTYTPSQKLDVYGNIILSANNPKIAFNDINSLWIGNANTANTLTFNTSGVERMRINNTGSVGIGTSDPQAKLEVIVNDGVNCIFQGCRYSSDTEGTNIRLLHARGNSTTPSCVLLGDVLGAVSGVGYGSTSWTGTASSRIDFAAEENFTDTAHGSNIRFITTQNGTLSFTRQERMRITNSGNVGIGTTTPSYKLHVNGSVAGTSAYNNLSDRREKENIDYNFQYGLSEILLLKPAKFDYLNGEKEHLGFIAQDVNEVIPEIIGSFQKDVNGTQEDRLTIKESSIIPVLVKAIQELTSRLEKLESKKSKK